MWRWGRGGYSLHELLIFDRDFEHFRKKFIEEREGEDIVSFMAQASHEQASSKASSTEAASGGAAPRATETDISQAQKLFGNHLIGQVLGGGAGDGGPPRPDVQALLHGVGGHRSAAALRSLMGASGFAGRVPAAPTPVQLASSGEGVSATPAEIHRAAAFGLTGASQRLPYGDRIQKAFGAHRVDHVKAIVGGPAELAGRAMGALAYATGSTVAFRHAPDLHTAAHEAAHVVQQRGGVQLKGGVGAERDAYERQADAVADAVVAGRSAEGLLNEKALSPGGVTGDVALPAVQLKEERQASSERARRLVRRIWRHYWRGGKRLTKKDAKRIRKSIAQLTPAEQASIHAEFTSGMNRLREKEVERAELAEQVKEVLKPATPEQENPSAEELSTGAVQDTRALDAELQELIKKSQPGRAGEVGDIAWAVLVRLLTENFKTFKDNYYIEIIESMRDMHWFLREFMKFSVGFTTGVQEQLIQFGQLLFNLAVALVDTTLGYGAYVDVFIGNLFGVRPTGYDWMLKRGEHGAKTLLTFAAGLLAFPIFAVIMIVEKFEELRNAPSDKMAILVGESVAQLIGLFLGGAAWAKSARSTRAGQLAIQGVKFSRAKMGAFLTLLKNFISKKAVTRGEFEALIPPEYKNVSINSAPTGDAPGPAAPSVTAPGTPPVGSTAGQPAPAAGPGAAWPKLRARRIQTLQRELGELKSNLKKLGKEEELKALEELEGQIKSWKDSSARGKRVEARDPNWWLEVLKEEWRVRRGIRGYGEDVGWPVAKRPKPLPLTAEAKLESSLKEVVKKKNSMAEEGDESGLNELEGLERENQQAWASEQKAGRRRAAPEKRARGWEMPVALEQLRLRRKLRAPEGGDPKPALAKTENAIDTNRLFAQRRFLSEMPQVLSVKGLFADMKRTIVVGERMSKERGIAIMDRLVRGDRLALDEFGISELHDAPAGLEWGLGELETGDVVLLRGRAGVVDFGPLRILRHSHELRIADGSLKPLSFRELLFDPRLDANLRNALMPSLRDIILSWKGKRGVPEHVLQTTGVVDSSGRISLAPHVGHNLPTLNVRIRNPRLYEISEGVEGYAVDLVAETNDGAPIASEPVLRYRDPVTGDSEIVPLTKAPSFKVGPALEQAYDGRSAPKGDPSSMATSGEHPAISTKARVEAPAAAASSPAASAPAAASPRAEPEGFTFTTVTASGEVVRLPVEQIGVYSINGSKQLVGNEYVRMIQYIYADAADQSLAGLKGLVRELESEAMKAGASSLRIVGLDIKNVRFLRPAIARAFGFHIEELGPDTITMVKPLAPSTAGGPSAP
jgi:Domain of unknown function (DUF4157)